MSGTRGLARALLVVLAAASLAPAEPASCQSFDPREPQFWAMSGFLLLTAWNMDAHFRRDDPLDRGGIEGSLASAGYRIGGQSFMVPAFLATTAFTHATGWPTDSQRVVRVLLGAAAAGVAVEAVKTTVGRGRPRDVGDPREFQAFSRDNAWLAFPSGHSAAAFAVAAALDEEFDLKGFQYLGYGIAGMVAWSRVYHDAHWASDTVAGAVIGIAAARTTVAWLNRLAADSAPDVRLGVYAGAPLIAVTIPAP
jgi:membrane-associated phospholipid phosphatase